MPIISPWIFYLIDVLNDFNSALFFLMGVSILALFVMLLYFLIEDPTTSLESDKMALAFIKKWAKRAFIALALSSIVTVIIPSQDTMYKMLVANHVTYENVETATDAIKDGVDYIFEKLDEEE